MIRRDLASLELKITAPSLDSVALDIRYLMTDDRTCRAPLSGSEYGSFLLMRDSGLLPRKKYPPTRYQVSDFKR